MFSVQSAYRYARRKGLSTTRAEDAASYAAEFHHCKGFNPRVAAHYGMLRAKSDMIRENRRNASMRRNGHCKIVIPFDGSNVRYVISTLSDELREFCTCLQAGMTQDEIASKLECSQPSVSRMLAELRKAFA